MINNTGAPLFIIDKYGEIVCTIQNGEKYNIRSCYQVVSDKNFLFVKKENIKGTFHRVMDNTKILSLLKNNKSLAYPLLALTEYIEPETNFLVKDGKKLKIIDFANIIGMTKQRVLRIFKELKSLDILDTIKTKKGQYYALNPFYFNKSGEIIMATKLHFENKMKGNRR